MNFKNCKIVTEGNRLDFLFGKLGKDCIKFENMIYPVADRFLADYNGGYWEFVDCDNGAFFMYPQKENYHITCDNYFDEDVDAIVAGIILTMYALSWSNLSDAYFKLRDYTIVLTQEEQRQIFAALD